MEYNHNYMDKIYVDQDIYQNVEKWIEIANRNLPENYNTSDDIKLYATLIVEEYSELIRALIRNDDVEIIDGCLDLIWVALGFMVSRANHSGFPISRNDLEYLNHVWTKESKTSEDWERERTHLKIYVINGINMKFNHFIEQYFENGEFIDTACIDLISFVSDYMRVRNWNQPESWRVLLASNHSKFVYPRDQDQSNTDSYYVLRDKNGKIVKPAGFVPADFSKFVNNQNNQGG